MGFKPIDKSIRDLLGSKHQFIIPRFQRDYSWDKRIVLEFIHDIVDNLQVKGGTVSTSPYFLGTMLFIGDFVEDPQKEIVVVDGQQRITSITILFSAISDIFRSKDQDALSQRIFDYIMAKDDNDSEFKVLKSKSNEVYFSLYIQDRMKEEDVSPESEEAEIIHDTYEIYKSFLEEDNLRKYLKKKYENQYDGVDYLEILKAIRDQVLGCTFISISTSDHGQANKIFEILNAKGKRLAHIDLIKNKIFEIFAKTEPLDVAEMKWEKVKELCSKSDVGLGTFYRHFWISKYKKSGASQLYDHFLTSVPQEEEPIKSFLSTLVKEAENYLKIAKPNLEHYDNRQEYIWLVQALRTMSLDFNIALVRVPIMALMFAKENELLSAKKYKEAILYLDGFHYAYTALLSGKANKLDPIYSQFAISLRESKSKDESNRIVDSLLIQKLEPLFPKYPEFEERFISLTFSKKENPDNLRSRYAIRKLNAYYAHTDNFDTNESVEHIAPEVGNEAALNIGNLISLETALNVEADQNAYDAKKAIYKKSKYVWIKRFVDLYPGWDETKFEERAKQMANDFYYGVLNRKKEDEK